MSRTDKRFSAFSVAEIILIILLISVIAAMIFIGVVFHKDNTATSVFGYCFYRTKAVNMETSIPQGTIIVAKESENDSIEAGSVILCKIGEYTVLTRVTEVQDDAYIVKFDVAPDNETFRVEKSAVIAKAVWQLEAFGKFIDFATSTVGIIIVLIIPLTIIIAVQVIRINRLKALEREASSLDDIDDVINSRRKEEAPAVTFTKPKFGDEAPEPRRPERSEVSPLVVKRPRSRDFDFDEDDLRPKSRLTVDSNGRADFVAEEKEPVRIPENETPNERLERISGIAKHTSPVSASAKASSGSEPAYAAAPTRITADAVRSSEGERVVFTPHVSNVIPDSLANIQEEAAAKSGFDESVKNYFEKNDKPTVSAEEKPAAEAVSTIPENAVVPKENIAPVRKKKSSKTLEELMSIIDAEETKLKK